jgi:hypothetical protein
MQAHGACSARVRRARGGRIVLVQFAALGAGENGSRFTVKKYHWEKTVTPDGWRHDPI